MAKNGTSTSTGGGIKTKFKRPKITPTSTAGVRNANRQLQSAVKAAKKQLPAAVSAASKKAATKRVAKAPAKKVAAAKKVAPVRKPTVAKKAVAAKRAAKAAPAVAKRTRVRKPKGA